MAVLIWVAIYPTIALFGNHFAQINPLPLRTFAITVIVVPFMVFLLIPLLQRLLINWLKK